MEKKKNAKKLKLSLFEIIWYTLCALIFLWGLTYIVLGLIANYAPIPDADNELLKASTAYAKVFKMGFFEYGLIHVGVAWLLSIVVLLIYSKKSDREFEKEQRRAALRASARKSMGLDDDVVEAEVSEEPREEEAEAAAEEAHEEAKPEAAEEAPVEEAAEEKAEEPVEEESKKDSEEAE